MVGRIIGFICCALCAIPFFFIPKLNKKNDPISFWSGDNTLKDKVDNVEAYNKEMSMLYRVYGTSFLLAGIFIFFDWIIGVLLLCICSTVGIFLIYFIYKKILKKYMKN